MKTKQCAKCKVKGDGPKPVSAFAKAKGRSDGLQAYCKLCHRESVRGKYAESKVGWKKQNKSRVAELHVKRFYNMSQAQYEKLFHSQQSACAICRREIVSIFAENSNRGNCAHVDHCHVHGEVRGLLCAHCNRGLGGFEDNLYFLLGAIRYLRDSRNRVVEKTDESRHDSSVECADDISGPQSNVSCESQRWLN